LLPLREYRDVAAPGPAGQPPAVLLLEFMKGTGSAREFRTSSLGLPGVIPPLAAVTVDPETRVVALEKSARNPYDAFLFVGRASTSDVIIRDSSISKSHAVIEPQEEGWYVRDNRSRNGTWLNGQRLQEGERVKLRSGDVLVLGSYPVYFLFAADLARILARPTVRPPPR
jgi:hypothetical protein